MEYFFITEMIIECFLMSERYRQRQIAVRSPEIDPRSFGREVMGDRVEITEEGVGTERRHKRVVTSVSEVEKWLPRIYGVREGEKRENIEAGITGETLHRLHCACNLIAHDNVGPRLAGGLPTAKLADVAMMQKVTDGLFLRPGVSIEEIEAILLTAWQRCFQFQQVIPVATLPMFEGMGFGDPRTEDKFRQSEQLDLAGKCLAKTWARVIGGGLDTGLEGDRSVSEVTVVVNTDDCQFRARLDTITLFKRGDKSEIWVVDLKTGRSEMRDWLEIEIQKRQSQMMLFMAEKLMGKYIRSKGWLEPTGRAYVLNARVDNWKEQRRCHFAYLRFDRETGEMKLEEVQVSKTEREEFGTWLDVYVAKIRELRPIK
jgi:hypothetical protein